MSKFCTGCGNELRDDDKFCAKCGKASVSTVKKVASVSVEDIAVLNNKQKTKSMLPLIFTMVIVLLMGIMYFMFSNSGPSKEDIQKSLTAFITSDYRYGNNTAVFNIKKLDIHETNIDDTKTFSDVRCTVTLESEDVRKVQSYQVKYTKIDDKDWVMDSYYPYNQDLWTVEALKGVGTKTIKNCLYGQKVNVGNLPITLSVQDIEDVRIEKQVTDLKAGKDEVSFSYKIKSKIASATQHAKAVFSFDKDKWILVNMQHDENSSITLNKGFEFKRTNEMVKNDIYKSPIYWKSRYGTQTIKTNDGSLRNLKVQPEVFEWKSGLVTQKISFDLVKRVANLHVLADVIYEYTSTGWTVKNIHYKTKVENIALQGKWTGHYSTWGGKPSLNLYINTQDANGMLTATFDFGPSASAPDYKTGSYSMVGGIEKETLVVTLKGNNWINRPSGFWMVDLSGVLLIDEEKIADKGYDFSVSKTSG